MASLVEGSPGALRRPVAAAGAALVALGLGAAVGALVAGRPDAARHEAVIARAAAEFGVDPALVGAIVAAESGGDSEAVSRTGAVGLMQLMPATAAEQAARLDLVDPDLTDPAVNVRLGTGHLARLLASFEGQVPLAVAAYNAGAARAREWADRAPHLTPIEVVDALAFDETRQYVHRVLAFRDGR